MNFRVRFFSFFCFLQAFQQTKEKMVFPCFVIFQTSRHLIYVNEAPQEKNTTNISKQVPILNTFSQKFVFKYQDNIPALQQLAMTFLLLS